MVCSHITRTAACSWVLVAGAVVLAGAVVSPLLEAEHAKLRCSHKNCTYVGGNGYEHEYQVEGKNIIINHSADTYINVICSGSNVLDSPALPCADTLQHVLHVTLSGCPPPSRSLAATLAALNVSLKWGIPGGKQSHLTLEELPEEPHLDVIHFVGLEPLLVLRLAAAVDTHVVPKPRFLRQLNRLEGLIVQDVELPPGELDDPRPALRTLSLRYAGVEWLPKALLNSTSLRQLTFVSETAIDVGEMPLGLEDLNLESPATKLQLDAMPALKSLMVTNWVEEKPVALTNCGNLISLQLISPALSSLPSDWLANCSRLDKLELQYATNLTSLPANLLRNVSALKVLSFKTCALESLPPNLLDHIHDLRELHLNENSLLTLPSGLFAVAQGVSVLNLSSNKLDGDALDALAPLENLTQLHLASNNGIGNLCDTNGHSPFFKSTKLTELILRGTNVTKICSDWREVMTSLETLDLRNTKVSDLWFENLQFKRNDPSKESVVLLEGAPVALVGMLRNNYNDAIYKPRNDVFVQLDKHSMLKCDCNMYWTWRALKASALKYISPIHCAPSGRELNHMTPEDMTCPVQGECAEPGKCACSWRPDDDPSHGRKLVRVLCEGRGLDHVPHLEPTKSSQLFELLLAHNHIAELPADLLLRRDIKRLDLRNNSIRTVNAKTATRLGSFDGTLQLAGNRLDCSCSAAPMLHALRNRPSALTDLSNITCDTDTYLVEVAIVDCPSVTTWIACGVAALLALTVAVVVFLASRERRFFFKAVLHRWGCLCYTGGGEEDDGRRYDAFVTFSHKDEDVVLELIARLEPTYRLCVHYRDWIPGHYITEQIVDSVQESRRTIALVSRHFLNSGWALAEFRQAHAAAMLDAKPRLIVVLLEDPSTLELDEQLRRYLSTNTYVRWGDPWFWDKLALALPRSRSNVTVATAAGPHAAPTCSPAPSLVRPAAAPHAARRPAERVRAPVPSPTSDVATPLDTHSPSTPIAVLASSPVFGAASASPALLAVPVESSAETGSTENHSPPDTQVKVSTDDSTLSPLNEPAHVSVRLPPTDASPAHCLTLDVIREATPAKPASVRMPPTDAAPAYCVTLDVIREATPAAPASVRMPQTEAAPAHCVTLDVIREATPAAPASVRMPQTEAAPAHCVTLDVIREATPAAPASVRMPQTEAAPAHCVILDVTREATPVPAVHEPLLLSALASATRPPHRLTIAVAT